MQRKHIVSFSRTWNGGELFGIATPTLDFFVEEKKTANLPACAYPSTLSSSGQEMNNAIMRPNQSPAKMGRLDLFFLSFILLFASPLAQADCECGYRVTVPTNSYSTNSSTSGPPPSQYVFTDLIETNFANISDISKNTDWVRQAFNTTAEVSRGTFGESMAVDNVVTSTGSGDGLQITVKAEDQVTDGLVSGGEIDSARRDLWYGTYRSSIKLTDVAGTVSAFFWVSAAEEGRCAWGRGHGRLSCWTGDLPGVCFGSATTAVFASLLNRRPSAHHDYEHTDLGGNRVLGQC